MGVHRPNRRRAQSGHGRFVAGAAVLLLGVVASFAGGSSPVSAGTSPPNCPTTTFNVSTDAEFFAALTCFNAATATGAWTIDVQTDITYSSAAVPTIQNSTSGVSLIIDGNGNSIDAATLSRVIRVQGATLTVQDIELKGGNAPGAFTYGGGLWASNGTILIQRSLVTGNSAGNGGGIATNGGSITVLNSTVSGNTATTQGGGIHNESPTAPLTVVYSTVTNNSAPTGSGISTWGSATIATPTSGTRIAASIVSANSGGGSDLQLAYETTKDTFTSGGYNVIGTVGAGMAAVISPDVVSSTPGLSPLQPRFQHALNAHHPGGTSPAIDIVTGTPNLFGVADPASDQSGNVTRPVQLFKDAGAAEGFSEMILFLNSSPQDGTDHTFGVTTPSSSVTTILDDAVPDDADTIFNAQGYGVLPSGMVSVTYSPPAGYSVSMVQCGDIKGIGPDGVVTGTNATIDLAIGGIGACVYDVYETCSGFPMTVANLTELNDAIGCYNAETVGGTYEIIVGNDITYMGGADSIPIDNSTAGVDLVITGNGNTLNAFDDHVGGTATTTDAVLTITNGTVVINNTTFTGADRGNNFDGGGIHNEGHLTLNDVNLENNLAAYGGGVYNRGGTLIVNGGNITNNTGAKGGGGIYSGIGGPTLIVNNAIIASNHAPVFTKGGGGINIANGTGVIIGSAIYQNDAIQGGGIFNAGDTIISGSTISENDATSRGGGIAHDGFGDTLDIVNSTISLNEATGPGALGGGLWAPSGDIRFIYSTVSENEASGGAGISSGGSSFPIVKLSASIVAQNGKLSTGGDVEVDTTTSTHQPFITGNFNVLGTVPGAFGVGANDLIGADAKLAALAPYGTDLTATHRPDPASPVVDHVTGTPNLFGFTPDPVVLDQVMTARPQGAASDAGSIELRDTPLTLIDPGCFVYDSNGDDAGSLSPGSPRVLEVAGAGLCLPADATAVVLTATAKSPQGVGNLRISAAGVTPTGGVVNYTSNALHNSNTVTVPLSNDGKVQVEANNSGTDVRLIAIGYYSPSGTLRYFPVTPCAAADTRSGTGTFAGKQAAGAAYPDVDVVGTFNLSGDNQGGGQTDCFVPSDAAGVLVNAVAVDGTGGAGGLAIGVGGSEPSEPTTNFNTIGLNNAATTMVPVDANGKIATNITSLSGSPQVHVRLVVMGYFKAVGGQDYVPVNPCAAFDSRIDVSGDTNIPTGLFAGKRIAGTSGTNTTGTTTYNVTGAVPAAQGGELDCNVPTTATAVLINLVGIAPDSVGNFRAFASTTSPTGGVLNFRNLSPLVNNSNAVVVPLNAGNMDVFINSPLNDGNPTVHARGVILGYFVP